MGRVVDVGSSLHETATPLPAEKVRIEELKQKENDPRFSREERARYENERKATEAKLEERLTKMGEKSSQLSQLNDTVQEMARSQRNQSGTSR